MKHPSIRLIAASFITFFSIASHACTIEEEDWSTSSGESHSPRAMEMPEFEEGLPFQVQNDTARDVRFTLSSPKAQSIFTVQAHDSLKILPIGQVPWSQHTLSYINKDGDQSQDFKIETFFSAFKVKENGIAMLPRS